MKKLVRGILEFRKTLLPARRDLFARLAKGQSPDTLFVTCSDSRVAPNWFASTDPGDLLVLRNIGNLVPPCSDPGCAQMDHSVAAAIEFSLSNLKITDIVVCGHSGCGAIHAVALGVETLPQSGLKDWLKIADHSLKQTPLNFKPDSSLSFENQLSQRSALQQIENLKTYPNVQAAVRTGKLKLHAWWFDIATAGIHAFDEDEGRFVLIDEKMGEKLIRS